MALVPTTIWPTQLGSPRVDGLQFAHTPHFRRTEVGQGVARYRRRGIRLPTRLSLSFWFDAPQFRLFEEFYYGAAGGGANPFIITVQTTYGQQQLWIRMGPYTSRYMDILQATQVDFECIYDPPVLTLTAAQVSSQVLSAMSSLGSLATETTGPGPLSGIS